MPAGTRDPRNAKRRSKSSNPNELDVEGVAADRFDDHFRQHAPEQAFAVLVSGRFRVPKFTHVSAEPNELVRVGVRHSRRGGAEISCVMPQLLYARKRLLVL